MSGGSVRIRGYSQGDERTLIDLWNAAYEGYAGYVDRDEPYWRWCILERPGVGEHDVLILEAEGIVVGYGVLGPQGAVLEFAIAPARPDREHLALQLLDALESRAQLRGDESVRVRLPDSDRDVCAAFEQRGYRSVRRESLQWVIVDLAGFVRRMLMGRSRQQPSGERRGLTLELTAGQYHFHPHPRLRIAADGDVQIGPAAEPQTGDVRVFTDLSTATDLVFQRRRFDDAWSAGDVRCEPSSGRADVQQLFELLRVSRPWFTPIADVR